MSKTRTIARYRAGGKAAQLSAEWPIGAPRSAARPQGYIDTPKPKKGA